MNTKNEDDIKGTSSYTKWKQLSELGEVVGQRHLELVERVGEQAEEGASFFRKHKGFQSDTYPTCYDM